MNSIGFKNFRRFVNFDPLEYGNITFLVGKNNSGKSTLVKAVLLLNSFLKSNRVDYLSFGSDVLNNANIVTYGRAFSQNSNSSEPLVFNHFLGEYQVILNVTSSNKNSTVAEVLHLNIIDHTRGFSFVFENETLSVSNFSLGTDESSSNERHNELKSKIEELEETLKTTEHRKSSKEYLAMVDQLQDFSKRLNYAEAVEEEELSEEDTIEFDIPEIANDNFSIEAEYDEKDSLLDILNDFLDKHEQMYLRKSSEVQKGEEVDDFEDYRAFYTELFQIRQSVSGYKEAVENINQYYLGASNTKQSAFFSIRDRKNALAQAIHDFNLLGIQTGDAADIFLKKWMGIFDLGSDYYIKEIEAGEGYLVLIERNGNEIHLADKGMGSVQLMLLLFRVAAIIRLNKGRDSNPMVIIEEPESNLHPALQSKLCDLFLEVYETYGINFMIETHSEYMIRKSQLLVKEKEYEKEPNDNPFSVIYFDKESSSTWNMEYREDGKFANDFGKGFYDESQMLVFKLL